MCDEIKRRLEGLELEKKRKARRNGNLQRRIAVAVAISSGFTMFCTIIM